MFTKKVSKMKSYFLSQKHCPLKAYVLFIFTETQLAIVLYVSLLQNLPLNSLIIHKPRLKVLEHLFNKYLSESFSFNE